MIRTFFEQPKTRLQTWLFIAMFALLVMEVTVTALWYQAIFRPRDAPLGRILPTLFVIIAVSYVLTRIMGARSWRMLYKQAVFLGWIILAIFASLKILIYAHIKLGLLQLIQLPVQFILHADASGADFAHLIWVVVLVWRGVALAREPITLRGVQISFQLGLIFLLLYGMIFAPIYPTEATIGMYLFLFFGLTAMSSARISNLSDMRGGKVPRFGSGWMLSILLSSLALVGIAILTGWLASSQVIFFVVSVFVGIFSVLTALIILLLSPLLIMLANLLPRIADFFQQIAGRLRGLVVSEQIERLLQKFSEGLEKLVPFMLASRGIILALVVVGLIMAILLAMRLRDVFRQMVEEGEFGMADPSGTNSLLQRLKDQFQNGVRRLRLRSPSQILAAARIRQIYRQMLTLCQKMGISRPSSATPLEFLPQIEALFPTESREVNAITRAYVRVRYGEYPETRGEIDEVELAWKRIGLRARTMHAPKKHRV